ncbi:hypothetical protein Dsin_024943 [Dipteronia sinensis]|uniref:Uncharacterized protein n=1 Tax=Dipteronia sinensis TaxID=43782 RepID=A0AAD9ZWE3_9ROSI|nr:hypothetical protein Dsin_024943 [Dipteronia sinensis]
MAEARALLEGILVAVQKGLFPLEIFIRSILCQFIPRFYKSVAQNIARWAVSHGVNLLWDPVFPDRLLGTAVADVSGFLPFVA